jgi:hypothetical protein
MDFVLEAQQKPRGLLVVHILIPDSYPLLTSPLVVAHLAPPTITMLPNNLNPYWAGLTLLSVWFLFIYSPPILIQNRVLQDAPFALHLMGAYTIYMACILNTMMTPSSCNGKAKSWHVVIGRVGMMAGILSFIFGVVCAWWPTRELPPTGFSIGITIGGAFQVYYQVMGYVAIKKYQRLKREIIELEEADAATDDDEATIGALEELKKDRDEALVQHIQNMVALFAIGCSAPAMVRFGLGIVAQYQSRRRPFVACFHREAVRERIHSPHETIICDSSIRSIIARGRSSASFVRRE